MLDPSIDMMDLESTKSKIGKTPDKKSKDEFPPLTTTTLKKDENEKKRLAKLMNNDGNKKEEKIINRKEKEQKSSATQIIKSNRFDESFVRTCLPASVFTAAQYYENDPINDETAFDWENVPTPTPIISNDFWDIFPFIVTSCWGEIESPKKRACQYQFIIRDLSKSEVSLHSILH